MTLSKSILPDLVDPDHIYVFKTEDYGVADYWYIDARGNYWKYTNAPEDSPDFDPVAGVALLVKSQPMPSTAPQFFTNEGKKRAVAVPQGVIPERNPSYSPIDAKNIWYEVYKHQNQTRFVYLDADVRENLDLWVQFQLRITDLGISTLRKYAVDCFNKTHPKDKIVGAMLMLLDQGLFEVDELVGATVGDVEFIDTTVKLLNRKLIADPAFLDFLSSITAGRETEAPLFMVSTSHGNAPFKERHIYSILHFLRVSPYHLLSWHACHFYSRIFNRLALSQTPVSEIEGSTLSELQRVFAAHRDVKFLVDFRLKQTLLDNYREGAEKSFGLKRFDSDDFAVLTVYSDLVGKREDEKEFSQWLHSQPMHDIAPEEEEMIDEALTEEPDQEDAQEVSEDSAGDATPSGEG